MRDLSAAYPSADNLTKVAINLGINNHKDEAIVWLRRCVIMVPADQQATARYIWSQAQKEYPELAGLRWPG
jgi:hypothetical protein